MKSLPIIGVGALSVGAILSGCGPSDPTPVRPPIKACAPAYPAGAVFTVVLPVTLDEAPTKLCRPTPPQRLDALVPPVQPGSGAASQVDQIHAMGGEPTANLPGDSAGYMRGRTVDVDLVPLVASKP